MSLSSVMFCSGKIGRMTSLPNLDQLSPEKLRTIAVQLMQRVESLDQKVECMDKQIHHYKTVNDKLTHEIAQLKRFKFAKRSEQLNLYQASLLDEHIDVDIVVIEAALEALQLAPTLPWPGRNQNAPPCRPSFRARRSITNPITRSAAVAALSSVSVRTSVRNSTTRPACSLSNSTSVASGFVINAKR